MLVEFRVENHRSIREEQALTFESTASPSEVASDSRVRQVSGNDKPVLTVAGIYGANASGKSNVLDALGFMREAVCSSHKEWLEDSGVPRVPFAWGPARAEPSLFEATVVIEGIRYQYGFVCNDLEILEEWLTVWKGDARQAWFTREGSRVSFDPLYPGIRHAPFDSIRPNTLFLAIAADRDREHLGELYEWFLYSRELRPHSTWHRDRTQTQLRMIARFLSSAALKQRDPFVSFMGYGGFELLERFIALLRLADLGIHDVRIEPEPGGIARETSRGFRVFLKHGKSEETWLPLEEESRGTQTLFHMGLEILAVLQYGSLLIIDEIESSLHPTMARRLVHFFHDPESNPRGAQLLFSTHDTNLIGNTTGDPELRRDQIWFTEKNQEGATALYPLTDFTPRPPENLERGYLQGRYGAIPYLGLLSVRGE